MYYVSVPVKDVIYTNSTDEDKPHNYYWCEQKTNFMCPIMLQHKEAYQNGTCNADWSICKYEVIKKWKCQEKINSFILRNFVIIIIIFIKRVSWIYNQGRETVTKHLGHTKLNWNQESSWFHFWTIQELIQIEWNCLVLLNTARFDLFLPVVGLSQVKTEEKVILVSFFPHFS